jgi:hypothetical protein
MLVVASLNNHIIEGIREAASREEARDVLRRQHNSLSPRSKKPQAEQRDSVFPEAGHLHPSSSLP